MEFYTENIHSARKEHRCALCRAKIHVGEKYLRRSGKYQGDFFDDCLHLHCNKIIAKFCKEQKDNEWEAGWIEEWLIDKYCDNCEIGEPCMFRPSICELIIKEYKEIEK